MIEGVDNDDALIAPNNYLLMVIYNQYLQSLSFGSRSLDCMLSSQPRLRRFSAYPLWSPPHCGRPIVNDRRSTKPCAALRRPKSQRLGGGHRKKPVCPVSGDNRKNSTPGAFLPKSGVVARVIPRPPQAMTWAWGPSTGVGGPRTFLHKPKAWLLATKSVHAVGNARMEG
jgi:hypothetical protein